MKKDDFKTLDNFSSTMPMPDGVEIPRTKLVSALRRMGNVANSNNVLPVLKCGLIETGSYGIRITVDNLDIRLTAMIDTAPRPENAFLLPFSFLKTYCNSNRAEKVYLRSESDTRIAIACGSSTASIPALYSKDFPEGDDISENFMQIESGERLFQDLATAAKFCSADDTRRAIQCVMFENGGSKTSLLRLTGKGCLSEKHLRF